jgi:hypothetical protein
MLQPKSTGWVSEDGQLDTPLERPVHSNTGHKNGDQFSIVTSIIHVT